MLIHEARTQDSQNIALPGEKYAPSSSFQPPTLPPTTTHQHPYEIYEGRL